MTKAFYLADFIGSRANNITLIRLVAALLVLFEHCYELSNGAKDPVSQFILPFMGFHMGLGGTAVETFFVLSGFLITGSYVLRANLVDYLVSRILRIYPALIVALLFCIGVGAFISELPVYRYFSHTATIRFLWSNGSLFEFWPLLPEVFVDNPWPNSINESLWTLPIEIRMYMIVATLGIWGCIDTRKRFNFSILMLIAAYALGTYVDLTVSNFLPLRLALFFLLGSVAYVNAQLIPMRFSLLGLLGVTAAIFYQTAYYDYAFSVFFAYFILIIAYHPLSKLPSIDLLGDLSYGAYLYAYPITQVSVKYLGGERPLLIVSVVTLLTLALARLSWILIEQPALRKKNSIADNIGDR